MRGRALYLRSDVAVEPLFNSWYAWPYLVYPASAAMYVANLHVKLMRSFVSMPQVHVETLKDPAMRGGPFLAHPADRAPGVRALLERTLSSQGALLRLAEAIREVDTLLQAEARGGSLDGLYPRIPDALQGLVELTYDLSHTPSVRFLDRLLYRSEYYSRSSQTVCLTRFDEDARPFALSTPRLEDAGLHAAVSFDSAAIDLLARSRTTPQPVGDVYDALELGPGQSDQMEALFTEEAPPPAGRYEGDAVRVRYFGHAAILVETRDVSVLFDPVFGYKAGGEASDRYSYADLPPSIDYVVITHNHQDHLMLEPLLQLRHRVGRVVVPRGSGGDLVDLDLGALLGRLGFPRVTELSDLERLEIPGGELVGLPFLGEHASLDIRTKLGYSLRLGGKNIVVLADSNIVAPRVYERIRDEVGDADLMFLGMECDGAPMSWLYGPLLSRPISRQHDQSRRFDGSDFTKAALLVDLLTPRRVCVYAMGQEPWLQFIMALTYNSESRPIVESDRLVAHCRERGVGAERLFGKKEILL